MVLHWSGAWLAMNAHEIKATLTAHFIFDQVPITKGAWTQYIINDIVSAQFTIGVGIAFMMLRLTILPAGLFILLIFLYCKLFFLLFTTISGTFLDATVSELTITSCISSNILNSKGVCIYHHQFAFSDILRGKGNWTYYHQLHSNILNCEGVCIHHQQFVFSDILRGIGNWTYHHQLQVYTVRVFAFSITSLYTETFI